MHTKLQWCKIWFAALGGPERNGNDVSLRTKAFLFLLLRIAQRSPKIHLKIPSEYRSVRESRLPRSHSDLNARKCRLIDIRDSAAAEDKSGFSIIIWMSARARRMRSPTRVQKKNQLGWSPCSLPPTSSSSNQKSTKTLTHPKYDRHRLTTAYLFTADHSSNLLSQDNDVVSATNQLEHTAKLDVDHRNSYNRTINRFQRSPQIVVDDNDYLQASDLYYSSSVDVSASASAYGGAGSAGGPNAYKTAGYYRGSLSAGTSFDEPNAGGSSSGGGANGGGSIDSTRRYVDRRKKTVRFDGQESNDWTRWDSERQNSQDSTTRDSGIDTSSTFTSSEDSNRGDGFKVLFSNPNLTQKTKQIQSKAKQ